MSGTSKVERLGAARLKAERASRLREARAELTVAVLMRGYAARMHKEADRAWNEALRRVREIEREP